MFEIIEQEIKELVPAVTYQRGYALFTHGKVSAGDRNNKNTFSTTVSGSMYYFPIIRFDEMTRKITDFTCTCSAFEIYDGPCKHIIASLLYGVDSQNKLAREDIDNSQLFTSFEKIYLSKKESKLTVKEELNLDLTLNYTKDYHNGYGIEVSGKIGLDTIYVIKDFQELFYAIKNSDTHKFGVKFAFNPTIHKVNERDYEILKLLSEFTEIQKHISNLKNDYYSRKIPTKSISLSKEYTKRFFEVLGDKSFDLKVNKTLINTNSHIVNDYDLKFDIKVKKSILEVKSPNYFHKLTDDCSYMFIDNNIVKILETDRTNLIVCEEYLGSTETMMISNRDKGMFISSVLPTLKSIGQTEIDETFFEGTKSYPLVSEIYLDNYEGHIYGLIVFKYGENKIYPYSEEDNVIEEGIILNREVAKEAYIKNIIRFASDSFSDDGQFVVTGEKSLFNFVDDTIPELARDCHIYYDDTFNIKIRSNPTLKGGIEFNEKSDLFEFTFDTGDIDLKELGNILASIKEKKKYHKLRDGSFLPINDEENIAFFELIDGFNFNADELDSNMIEVQKFNALFIDSMIRDKGIHSLKRDQYFKTLVQDVKEPEDSEFKIPEVMSEILRDYQSYGYKWLKTLSYYGFGGILADDMGLGKTLQAITLIEGSSKELPNLVIAPTSLVYNWQDEIHKFAPNLKCVVLSGIKKERQKYLDKIKDYDVVITSYGMMRKDIDVYQQELFEYCFLDEAQHIKNANTNNAKTVKLLKAKHRFALTGTPIENSLTELWSIFDFIMPGYLSTAKVFREKYQKPISKNSDQRALERLTKLISPFILRRLKTDVLKELPPKIETRVTTTLNKEQKELYLSYLSKFKGEIRELIKAQGYNKSTMQVLSALTRLRQICCHPSLFIEDYQGESGKLQALEEIVTSSVEANHRILIFSQFTSMLSVIADNLKENSIEYFYLDGGTKAQKRRELVNRFNDGEAEVFLISLKAGGTGLNLTGADMVIHYDPWWNPAVEDQATDRAYRMGQDKSVQVIKLISEGTIEEKIFELQKKKKSLVDAVIKPGETLITKLSQEDLQSLFDD